jgi:membrane-bound lytic murein transglycosylase A
MKRGPGIAALAGAAMLAGCVPPAPPQDGALQAVGFAQIPGWSADALEQTLPALRAQCHRLALLPADTALGGAGLAAEAAGRAGQWSAPCRAALAVDPGDAAGSRRFYEAWFQPYRIGAPALVTGYYEPEVRGALARGGAYQTPLLARPTDLLQSPPPPGDPAGKPSVGRLQGGRLVPYWTRAEIEAGQAGQAARPLFWLADPADLFFLQVQGAGRVRLPDGSVIRVGYDGKNGRPYTPIGRVLAGQGAIAPQDVTMQSIRAWLAAHPDQARAVMDRNEDYVFFRVLTDADAGLGPPGALGVDLLAGRTAAVDRHAIPLATPVFLDTTDPVTGAAWRRLLLAQDLGTDIVGPARVDVFLGSGDAAALRAGRMRQAGTQYVLLPRPSS